MQLWLINILAIVAAQNLTESIKVAIKSAKFCWKPSAKRALSTEPSCETNQERRGDFCYEKCKQGYHGVGAVCWKESKSYHRRPVTPQCGEGSEMQDGLCYKQCNKNQKGVGLICWRKCPRNIPVDCGLGCANTKSACSMKLADQALSVGFLAYNLASLGTSVEVKSAAKLMLHASKLSKKQQSIALEQITIRLIEAGGIGMTKTMAQGVAIQLVTSSMTGEGLNWQIMDPTGISSVIKAFREPIC